MFLQTVTHAFRGIKSRNYVARLFYQSPKEIALPFCAFLEMRKSESHMEVKLEMLNDHTHATIATLEAEMEDARKRVKYYADQENRILREEIPRLTRAARTNRLCTRAGMLEKLIGKPELLTNEQVWELLVTAFRQKEVQELLTKMIKVAGTEDEEEARMQ